MIVKQVVVYIKKVGLEQFRKVKKKIYVRYERCLHRK